ncbi:TPA: flippase [Citrobacter freundii]|uniref:flippase n=1 Tax=Citrobacter freundii complex TaxID=1344959 RepID=UPI0004DA6FEF|nr:flippase [Citrobacter freundii]EGT0626428.1 flippase [Citrobacter freundii]EKW3668185.1 flippase [Citrobacter freundii]ELI7001308.1 flippase [Citrobacter freundii]ELK7470538.1 flippase [Citrobacter freundii]KEL81156.1 polysaccharide biosynthesis family protein [Citrobacter freundii]
MNRNLLKNIISLLSVQGANYIIPLLTLPFLVVTLGPKSFGNLSFSLAVIQYFVLLVDYGFSLSATKQVSTAGCVKKTIGTIFWSVLVCKIILFAISLIILVVLINSNEYINSNSLVLFCSLGLVLGNVFFPVWLFQGLEKMGTVSLINIATRFLSVPLIFLMVKEPHDDWIVALIYSLVAVLAGIISLLMAVKMDLIKRTPITYGDVKFQFSNGWHLFISSASVSLYTTSVTVILGFVAGPHAVGFFSSADKIRQAFQGLIVPVSQACFPRINAVLTQNRDKGIQLINLLLKLQSFCTLFMSVCLFFLSPYIIHLLYGEDYENSVTVLKLLAFCPFLVGVSNVLGIQTMLSLGYSKEFSRILLIAGCISLAAIYPLTKFMNEDGAAISVLLTESIVVVMMIYFIYIKKKLLRKRDCNEI